MLTIRPFKHYTNDTFLIISNTHYHGDDHPKEQVHDYIVKSNTYNHMNGHHKEQVLSGIKYHE